MDLVQLTEQLKSLGVATFIYKGGEQEELQVVFAPPAPVAQPRPKPLENRADIVDELDEWSP